MKRYLGFLIGLVTILGLGLLGWLNRYNLYDAFRLYHYKPPVAIVQLADQTTMTPRARRLFYVYHPVIENSMAFNQDCQVTEQAIVLGCTVINKGIYLYDVKDPELNGVEQVTAAHEMLHIVYSRLSHSELSYINNLVLTTYNQLAPSNSVLKGEYQSYLKTEGSGAVLNELHSVLGTEISQLPPTLENYYKQFFTNRQVIVNYASHYENLFLQRQQMVEQDDQQLSTWQQTIGSDESQLQLENQQLASHLAQLNQLRSSDQVDAYNNSVASYNQEVVTYNNLINQTKQLINQYNNLLAVRNSIALSENKLVQSISSLPSTITAQ
jgi:hypothetical protein